MAIRRRTHQRLGLRAIPGQLFGRRATFSSHNDAKALAYPSPAGFGLCRGLEPQRTIRLSGQQTNARWVEHPMVCECDYRPQVRSWVRGAYQLRRRTRGRNYIADPRTHLPQITKHLARSKGGLMNECPKMGTVLVPLNGGLWVALSKPSVLSKVVIYAGNAIHNRPNGIFLKRLGVD